MANGFDSCVLLFLSIDNVEKGPGPKSRHARERDAQNAKSDPDLAEKAISEPEQPHAHQIPSDGATDSDPAAERRPSREG